MFPKVVIKRNANAESIAEVIVPAARYIVFNDAGGGFEYDLVTDEYNPRPIPELNDDEIVYITVERDDIYRPIAFDVATIIEKIARIELDTPIDRLCICGRPPISGMASSMLMFKLHLKEND